MWIAPRWARGMLEFTAPGVYGMPSPSMTTRSPL
jgi:hypothetical protein